MSLDIVYYSNKSGNTKRFAEKIVADHIYSVYDIPVATRPYVLFVPTYGAGNDGYSVPQPIKTFLSLSQNINNLVGVVGFGNINFGTAYCKAAEIISRKFGVPIIGRVELFGTPEDVEQIQERLGKLNDKLQLS